MPAVILIFCGAVVALGAYVLRGAVIDDVLIYARVSENLLGGKGWSFNSGEAVNPCSSPLYTLILAVVMALGVGGYNACVVAFAAGVFAGLLSAFAIGRRISTVLAVAVMGVFLLNGSLLEAVGLETSWYLAGVLIAAYLYEIQRYPWCGVALAAVSLIRPEGVILPAIVVALDVLRERRLCAALILPALLLVGAWLLFSFFAFGEIVPHTVSIKAYQGSIEWNERDYPFFVYLLGRSQFFLLTWILAILGVLRSVRLLRSGNVALPLVIAFGALQVAGYSVAGAPIGYEWYFAPGILSLNIALMLGLWETGSQIHLRHARAKAAGCTSPQFSTRPYAVALGFGLAILTGVLGADPPRIPFSTYRLAAQYRNAAKWIAKNTSAASRVAATEIGYLGYFSGRPIVDIHGLIHKEYLESVRGGPDWWFRQYTPEVIVRHRPAWDGEPTLDWPEDSRTRFEQNYQLQQTFGSVEVYVAIENPAPRNLGG